MFRHYSSSLMLVLLMLLGIGLVQVYSSSYIFAIDTFGEGLYFFKRQLVFTLIALTTLLLVAQIPLSLIEKWGWLLWIFSSLLVSITLVAGFGVKVGGASRWLQLPWGLRIEPSEFLKVSVSLLFASLLSRNQNFLARIPKIVLLLLFFIPLILLLRQPDFGSFTIILLVGLGLLFSFGLHWKYIIGATVVLTPLFYYLVMLIPYRKARIFAFLDPWADPEQKGFQVIQSMLSFHSGGITGVGLGQGQGKLFFLPEAHTDFTLAVFGEELGFIGFIILLFLYGFVIFKGFQISMKCNQTYQRALSLGISLTFFLSVFINIGVVLGLLPTKGLTLPFLSYGGSSLVAFCLMFGFLLNIEKNLKNDFSK